MKYRISGALILCALALWPGEDKTCSVEGKVVNAITGEPVRNAEVALKRASAGPTIVMSGTVAGVATSDSSAPPPAGTAVTDDQGRFSIAGFTAGTYALTAARVGFLASGYDVRGRFKSTPALRFSTGDTLKDQVIKLTPQGVVSGRVYDDEGHPVGLARVRLMRSIFSRGARQMVVRGTAETDSRGEYRIANVIPGKYVAVAEPPQTRHDPGADPPRVQEGLISTYYPGAPDLERARSLEVTAGMDLTAMDIRLVKAPLYRIRGTALDASGQPAAGAIARVSHREYASTLGYPGSVKQDGAFEVVGVAAGVYSLDLYRGGRVARQMIEIAGADLEGVTVKVANATTIVGSITLEKGGQADFSAVRLLLQPAEFGPANAFAVVGPAGAFVLQRVVPGRYALTVANLPEDWYIASVVGATLNGPNLDFTAGVPDRIQIIVSAEGGRITGALTRPETPLAGVRLSLYPVDAERKPWWLQRSGFSDLKGRFSLAGVAPGEYLLFAWEDVDSATVEDPEFRRQFEQQAVKISMARGATVEVKPAVIRTEPAK